ncbi:MAG: M23 family metallopeptidase, partial [Acidimicrobiales bacterium]|nr:M23 family metallopeptidase [Acidimicrobiales bacterium]
MLRGFRSLAGSAFAVMATLALTLDGVGAQTPPPATPPPTRSVLEDLVSSLLPTTTVTPPATRQPVPAPPAAGSAPATPPSAGSPTTTVPASACAGSTPPAAGGPSASGGARSSAPLVEALRRAQQPGAQATAAVVKGMGRFPVGGVAEYSDDWLAARSTPCFHLHKGTDVFAARGTPVRAPADGVLRFNEESVGGRVAYVTEADGTYYYMA